MPKAFELFLASQNEVLAYKTKMVNKGVRLTAALTISSEYRGGVNKRSEAGR
jgi:hypothetical protein